VLGTLHQTSRWPVGRRWFIARAERHASGGCWRLRIKSAGMDQRRVVPERRNQQKAVAGEMAVRGAPVFCWMNTAASCAVEGGDLRPVRGLASRAAAVFAGLSELDELAAPGGPHRVMPRGRIAGELTRAEATGTIITWKRRRSVSVRHWLAAFRPLPGPAGAVRCVYCNGCVFVRRPVAARRTTRNRPI